MIPTYEQLEEELKPYCVTALDKNGKPFQYLSTQKRNEYLVKKGALKFVQGDYVILQDSLTGAIPYVEYVNRIEILKYKNKYKKAGQMGVNKVDNITADEISL